VYVVAREGEIQAPPEDLRRAFVEALRDRESNLAAVLMVIEHSGFSGAAVRAVTTGIMLASRTRVPLKVVARAGDGAAWFADLLGDGDAGAPRSAAQLERLVEELRSKLRPATAA
jgi:hypothetical protein